MPASGLIPANRLWGQSNFLTSAPDAGSADPGPLGLHGQPRSFDRAPEHRVTSRTPSVTIARPSALSAYPADPAIRRSCSVKRQTSWSPPRRHQRQRSANPTRRDQRRNTAGLPTQATTASSAMGKAANIGKQCPGSQHLVSPMLSLLAEQRRPRPSSLAVPQHLRRWAPARCSSRMEQTTECASLGTPSR